MEGKCTPLIRHFCFFHRCALPTFYWYSSPQPPPPVPQQHFFNLSLSSRFLFSYILSSFKYLLPTIPFTIPPRPSLHSFSSLTKCTFCINAIYSISFLRQHCLGNFFNYKFTFSIMKKFSFLFRYPPTLYTAGTSSRCSSSSRRRKQSFLNSFSWCMFFLAGISRAFVLHRRTFS